METMISEMISRYKVVDELGRGGMAVVFKARDTTLDRNVAIKLILPGQQQTDRFLKRFIREAKTLAQLSHPNIVKILDFGEHQSSPYLVMEFMSGGSMLSKMGKPLSASEAAELLLPVAHALHHAHQHKIIHRDVKPQNILINEAGQPMLTDFGIVKLVDSDESQSLTGTGALVGTPSYMAPEQVKGRPIDARTDVYALGIIFFELVTGRKPYTANTPVEVTLKHLNEPIPKPRQIIRDLPQEAEHIIYKSMAKNPDDRYADMMAFSKALEKVAGKNYAPPRRAAVMQPEKKDQDAQAQPARKKISPLVWMAGGITLLAVIAGLIYFFLLNPGMGPVAALTPTATASATATSKPSAAVPTTAPTEAVSTQAAATVVPTETPGEVSLPAATPVLISNAISFSNLSQVAELNRIEKISVIQLDWSPDGLRIVDAGSKYLNLIDPTTMKSTGLIEIGNEIPKAIRISSDSKRAFVLLDTTVRVYDLDQRKLLNTFSAPAGANSMALSSDDKLIAVGVLNNKVQLINTEDGSVVRSLRSNFGGWSVAFSPDDALVAAGTTNGSLLWETQTGLWKMSGEETDLVKSLAFSKDGRFLAGGCSGKVFVWAINGGALYEVSGDFKNVNSLDFSPDGSLLVTGNEDYTVRLFHVGNSGDLSEARVLKSHTSPVYSVHFSPAGDFIVTGANEGVIRLWGLP